MELNVMVQLLTLCVILPWSSGNRNPVALSGNIARSMDEMIDPLHDANGEDTDSLNVLNPNLWRRDGNPVYASIERVDRVEEQIKNTTSMIEELKNAMKNGTGIYHINDTNSKIEELKNAFKNWTEKMVKNEETIHNLSNQIDELRQNIANLPTNISTNEETIDCANVQYATLAESWRKIGTGKNPSHCDYRLHNTNFTGENWFRFVEPAGTRMSDVVGRASGGETSNQCGTYNSGWMVGDHPTKFGEVVDRKICFGDGGSSTCRYLIQDLKVSTCSDSNGPFYLYKLTEAPASCSWAYCTK